MYLTEILTPWIRIQQLKYCKYGSDPNLQSFVQQEQCCGSGTVFPDPTFQLVLDLDPNPVWDPI